MALLASKNELAPALPLLSSNDVEQQLSPDTTFERFANFPAEVQAMIWRFTLKPRIIEVRMFGCYSRDKMPDVRLYGSPIPALSVCRASRELAQKFYKIWSFASPDSSQKASAMTSDVYVNYDWDSVLLVREELIRTVVVCPLVLEHFKQMIMVCRPSILENANVADLYLLHPRRDDNYPRVESFIFAHAPLLDAGRYINGTITITPQTNAALEGKFYGVLTTNAFNPEPAKTSKHLVGHDAEYPGARMKQWNVHYGTLKLT